MSLVFRYCILSVMNLTKKELIALLTLTPSSGNKELDALVCQRQRREIACYALAGLLAHRGATLNGALNHEVDSALHFVEALIAGLEERT